MLVTTTPRPDERLLEQAARLAEELAARRVDRSKHTLAALMKQSGDPYMLVAGREGLRLADCSGGEWFFHPSMATVRVKRLLAGSGDAMLAAAGVRPGDTVVDCTMGLATDAIVFAHAVGPSGRVTALESEPLPYVLAREGLSGYRCEPEPLEQAMRRVQPVLADHLSYLKSLPDRSADIVYFDPMFRKSAAGSAIEPLRGMANRAALQPEAVAEAMRVARRTVVMKEHNRSGEFERLGFRPVMSGQSKITYGVIAL